MLGGRGSGEGWWPVGGSKVKQSRLLFGFFFFNDTATTEIYTLSLHDALPICSFLVTAAPHFLYYPGSRCGSAPAFFTDHFSLRQHPRFLYCPFLFAAAPLHFLLFISRFGSADRKSTRLNSSHQIISYAVFCLKKKKEKQKRKKRYT